MLDKLMPGVPAPAAVLGLGGLIPFIAAAVIVWAPLPTLTVYAVQGQLWYAATILSFLGAVHWGLAIGNYGGGGISWARLGWGVTPALIAWLGLLLSIGLTLPLYVLAFLLAFWVDLRTVRAGHAPAWYPALRRPLTMLATLSLVLVWLNLRLAV